MFTVGMCAIAKHAYLFIQELAEPMACTLAKNCDDV